MTILYSAYQVTFNELTNLFTRKSDVILLLDPCVGEGSVQIFNLEKGLQSRFWDCSFSRGIEMYSDAGNGVDNTYFTLAFFLNTSGLQFATTNTSLKENIIRDTIFISATSDYRLYVPPTNRWQCLSISFSKKWLSKHVLEGNEVFENLKEKIYASQSLSLLECTNLSEKKLIQELLDVSWKKSFGSFYIKSCVLKIISDFFYKIKQRETFSINNFCSDTLITEAEKYLSNHLTGKLPNLKELASSFSISESTLKRHFKKKYGVNMSAYFIQKKMEYARHLIREENTNITETASLLGYRNVNHFNTIFKKYHESFPA